MKSQRVKVDPDNMTKKNKPSNSSKPSTAKNERKRGRPAGKNRVALSASERRARNAQYERERRSQTADAMTELAQAVGCDTRITKPELLVNIIYWLQQKKEASSSDSIDRLRRINDLLEYQIIKMQGQLDGDPNLEVLLPSETSQEEDSD